MDRAASLPIVTDGLLLAGGPGTLVPVPPVVASQFMDEITAHSSLTVLHYTGIARHATSQ